MKKPTRSLDPVSRGDLHRDRVCACGSKPPSSGIWQRRGDYWEALLRFKKVLEREAHIESQLITPSDNLAEQPIEKAQEKVESPKSSE